MSNANSNITFIQLKIIFVSYLHSSRYPPYNQSKLQRGIKGTALKRHTFLNKIFGNPLLFAILAVVIAFFYKF